MAGRPRNQAATTAILGAAIGVLRERGYAALTLEEVARIAGVGKSSLYARFPGRPELATAAVASLQRDLPPPQGDLRGDLVSRLRAAERNLGQAGSEAVAALLATGPENSRQILGPFSGQARRQLEQAKARSELAPDADLEVALELLVAALLSRVLLRNPGAEPWPERTVDAVLTILGRSAQSRI